MNARPVPIDQATKFGWGPIFVLTLVNLLNYGDRVLVATLLPQIGDEFRLSDLQLGLLTGLGFALFYATLGIPLARIADRWNRKRLIALSIGLWSIMTAATGTAQGYAHLLLARVGVAIGEAGVVPAVHSLLGDGVPAGRRGAATGLVTAGASLGSIVALAAGGVLAEAFGWRIALFYAGCLGVPVLALFLFVVREPERGAMENASVEPVPIGALLEDRALLHLAFAAGGSAMPIFAMMQWLPSFHVRVHGLSLPEAGLAAAIGFGVSGVLGTILCGYAADILRQRYGIPASIRIMSVLVPVGAAAWAFALALPLVPSVAFIAVGTLIFVGLSAPLMISAQLLTPPRGRATAIALIGLMTNLIGFAFGPTLTGVFSDWLAPVMGDTSLRYALMLTMTLSWWPALHLLAAARALDRRHAASIPV